ncbi:MAG: hypothetical protein ACI9WU_004572 [Myxococcota bacterium]|jgi:hypothetical protein
MEWEIRYSGVAGGGLNADLRAALDAELSEAVPNVPGRLIREPGIPADLIFAGSLTPHGHTTHRDVQELLDFLTGLETSYDLNIRVEDTLQLVRRDPESGALALDMGGRSMLRPVPNLPTVSAFGLDESLIAEDTVEPLEEEALVGELQSMIDALTRPEADDDEVYMGPDPSIVPFSDLSPLVQLGPSVPIPVQVRKLDSPWEVINLRVVKRTDSRSGVTGFYVTGDLSLEPDVRAHLVAIDLVLRDDDGNVLGTEECFAGYDVRHRCEIEAEALMASRRAQGVARIDVGVDAYLRSDVKLATGRPTGGTLAEPQKDYPLTVNIRDTEWPDHGWNACGEVTNNGGRFLATMGLSLAVYDAEGELCCDDETELTMIAPGDSRAFELIALMDEDDNAEIAVVRGRFVTRSREVACHVRLESPLP